VKVLVSAYACEPDKGSEPGVGWHWSNQLSRFYDVWVITRSNNRESIEKELAIHPNPNLNFCYIDLPKWLSFWKKGQKGIYLYYCIWQLVAFLAARKLHDKHHFDFVHHITFGTVWLPTFMQFLEIPFIWGPIGGAEIVPKRLRTHLSLKWRIYEGIRDVMLRWTYSLDPISRAAMRKAHLIIARTRITREAFPPDIQKKTTIMIETGVSNKFINEMQRKKEGKPRSVVLMAGRMLHWKGFDLGIEAFSKVLVRFPETHLVIVGSGPEGHKLKLLSEHLNVNQNITFTGQLPREEALRIMAQAHIFLMPSMKDAGAWVLYEAMASELPIVCLDYAGPAEIVDGSCAIAVPIGEKHEVVGRLSNALERLLASDALAESMGQASIERLRDKFLWDHKGEMMRRFYEKMLNT
jgi:glycosyltransferase involved in cell wall biosynthesis